MCVCVCARVRVCVCVYIHTSFDCVDHHKLWKILKKMGIPDHLTCLLRNMYAGEEATVRTRHGTADSVSPWTAVHQVSFVLGIF